MTLPFRSWFAPRGGKLFWLLVGDVVLVVLTFAAAHLLYAAIKYPFLFRAHLPEQEVENIVRVFKATPHVLRVGVLRSFLYTVPLLLVLRISCFGHFGLYRSGWRYAGLRDSLNIIKATSVSSGFFLICVVLTLRYLRAPYNVYIYIADWLMLTMVLTVTRFSLRIRKEMLSWRSAGKRNVLIVGAGDADLLMMIRPSSAC